MRWGLVPSWWGRPLKELPATFNARAETVAVKAMFQSAFKSRRCIIPASGFCEWTGPRKERTPHYFSSPDGALLAFAGLWECWRDTESDETILSATIIVCGANEWIRVSTTARPSCSSRKTSTFGFPEMRCLRVETLIRHLYCGPRVKTHCRNGSSRRASIARALATMMRGCLSQRGWRSCLATGWMRNARTSASGSSEFSGQRHSHEFR